MELKEPPDPQREQLIPVVSYAAEHLLTSGQADYWNHAMRLELAVLGKDETAARQALARALGLAREPWEPVSTANNLRLIRIAREGRGEDIVWAEIVEQELLRRAGAKPTARLPPTTST